MLFDGDAQVAGTRAGAFSAALKNELGFINSAPKGKLVAVERFR